MTAARGIVPNMINGISQQSQSQRLPSQGDLSENFDPTIVDGLRKRPRTEHYSFLADLPLGTFVHTILRDEEEKYIAAFLPTGAIRVWDFDGNEKTVNNTSTTYLAGLADPQADIRCLTVADFTFVVNTKKKVLPGTTRSPARPFEALVSVLSGNYGKTYSIALNGTNAASYTTPDGSTASHSTFIDTVFLANTLYGGLVTSLGNSGAPWNFGRYHSTLYIRNNFSDFSLGTQDGFSGRAMKEAKDVIQKFSDLPSFAPLGFKIKVAGTDTSKFDDYWVEFVKKNDTDTNGHWKECVAANTVLGVDPQTMPHILVREADGSFTFKAASWSNRVCGDEERNPDPSFVGQAIQEVFFHRNRLGFLTSENVVMSESGNFFNFFRTTLTALLDTDPIDVAASHIKVSYMRHAVPYQDVLILFSDQTQFKLAGNELLTPKTVNTKPLTEMNAMATIRPVVAGTSIYFVSERSGWASVWEYFLNKTTDNAETDEVTAHVPAYIPAGVRNIAASPDLSMMCVQTSAAPDAIFVYKFYFSGDQKLQSAWVRWRLPGVTEILDLAFDKGILIATVRRAEGVYIEALNCEKRLTDLPDAFTTHLDRHVRLQGVYNAGEDKTLFTLPYPVPDDLVAVTSTSAFGALPGGVQLVPIDISGNTFKVGGNLTGQFVRCGTIYTSRYRFSRFFKRSPDGKQVTQDGRLSILSMYLAYAQSAYFRVEVTPEGRETRRYPFNGRTIGDTDNQTGVVVLDDGKFSFPIYSRNDRVDIELVSDSWLPCGFVSAEWRGNFNEASRQQ